MQPLNPVLAIFVTIAGLTAQQMQPDPRNAVARDYATWCHEIYGRCGQRAGELHRAVTALVACPDAATLAAARSAWIDARRDYGMTEVFRFYDGPIEPLEALLNSWPVDEAYIDCVEGQPDAGIIQDVDGFPRIAESVLTIANERGGEANISLGWHAIEFLLWGQDVNATGPGDRPATDFDPALGRNAARRGEYLVVATELLTRQLAELEAAWAPDADNYRRRFEADPDGAVRRILTGATVLTAFELAGERLGVGYATQDQEQEHSCFSDTSHDDLVANQLGVRRVLTGSSDGSSAGLLVLVAACDRPLAAALAKVSAECLELLNAIPDPLDQAIRGDDDAPGRRAIACALDALERQAELLSIAGRRLGFDLPVRPAGG